MRITGGTLRGRTLKAPDGMGTRPTADRVREALFNIIAHHDWDEEIGDPLDGTHVLDAFAGTGALGLEAISRGAASCTFFENDRKALQSLRENIAHTKTDEVARVIQMDVTRAPQFSGLGQAVKRSHHPPRAGGSKLHGNFGEGFDKLEPQQTPLPENAKAFSVDAPTSTPQGEGDGIPERPSLLFLDPPYHKGLIERAVATLSAQGWIAPHALLVCETAKDEELDLPNCEELLCRNYGDTKITFWAYAPSKAG